MSAKSDTCSIPFCRKPSTIIIVGKPFCDLHNAERLGKLEAMATLKAAASARGKSLEDFLDTDIRRILEKAWEIQQRTGKAVPIDQLVMELNGEFS